MATIQVTPELLNSKATELRTLKTVHDENMAKMGTLIMGLNEIFKGAASDAYVAKYQSMQTTFTNFSQMLEDYAAMLDKAATEFTTKDSEVAATMSGYTI